MTWARIDCDFADHPKLAGLTEVEQFAYLKVILWCQKHDTEGVIEAHVPFRTFTRHSPNRTMNRLIEARLIEVTNEKNLVVPNFYSRQRVADQRKKRASDADRQRRHRSQTSQSDTHVTRDSTVTGNGVTPRDTSVSHAVTRAHPRTVRNERTTTPPPTPSELEPLTARDFPLPPRSPA